MIYNDKLIYYQRLTIILGEYKQSLQYDERKGIFEKSDIVTPKFSCKYKQYQKYHKKISEKKHIYNKNMLHFYVFRGKIRYDSLP